MIKLVNNLRWIWYPFLVSALIVAACNSSGKHEPKHAQVKQLFRCPMHPEIIRDKAGNCPMCGMDLIPFGAEEKAMIDIKPNTLVHPANSYVLTSIPVTSMEPHEQDIEVEALGTVAYDTREIGSISSKVSGRIEKLYLKYTFQEVIKGQKVMEIYSPELVTAQQNLIFLIKNDAANASFINAAKEKLLLLGVSPAQLEQIMKQQKPLMSVSVYSSYTGHVHDALPMNTATFTSSSMNTEPVVTRELMVKEGKYVEKGQTILTVLNPMRLWAVLNIYADDVSLVRPGDPVRVIPETAPSDSFRGKIDLIEPFFREGNKTVTARVYFANHGTNIPVGSQVRAVIYGNTQKGNWLPKDAVISLGVDNIVFEEYDDIFKAHKVKTGLRYKNKIEIIEGLSPTDTVASNAQFLIDSESFIKVKE